MGKGAQQTPGAGTLLAQAGPAGKVFTRDAVSKREDLCIVGNGRFSPAARRVAPPPAWLSELEAVHAEMDAMHAQLEAVPRPAPHSRLPALTAALPSSRDRSLHTLAALSAARPRFGLP